MISTRRHLLVLLAAAALLVSAGVASSQSSAQAGRLFTPYGTTPVVMHGSGAWDDRYTNPGAVVYYNGMYHMLRCGFRNWPDSVQWGYVTSPDGYTWTKQGDQPVFMTNQVPYAETGALASSALVLDDGTWVVYFYTVGQSSSRPQFIGRATAPAPTGPWKVDPEPVLKPGSPGTWDDTQVSRPSVIRTGGSYVMYYGGNSNYTLGMIGMATSADGIHWTKYNDPATTTPAYAESDPVFWPDGNPNAWDHAYVMYPHVQHTPDGWVMLYSAGATQSQGAYLGYATSSDGLHWLHSDRSPILKAGDIPDGRGIFDTNLLYQGGTYFVYWEITHVGGSDIFLATYKGSIPAGTISQPAAPPTALPTATPFPTEEPPTPTPVPGVAVPGNNSQTFAQTGKSVKGLFLDYWNKNGALAQQGYPISEAMREVSDLDGKPYTVQYFERAVFEYHPENKPPYNVLLSQLGTFRYKAKYPTGAPNQAPNNSPGSVLFPQTGNRLGGKFLDYWKNHGGLLQQGYPISNEFTEASDLNGKPYAVQYFERAVFEYHPENKPPYEVLLSQLGTFQFRAKYGGAAR